MTATLFNDVHQYFSKNKNGSDLLISKILFFQVPPLRCLARTNYQVWIGTERYKTERNGTYRYKCEWAFYRGPNVRKFIDRHQPYQLPWKTCDILTYRSVSSLITFKVIKYRERFWIFSVTSVVFFFFC